MRRALITAGLAAALLGAGCGAGDGDGPLVATDGQAATVTTVEEPPACAAAREINRLDDAIEAKVRRALEPLSPGATGTGALDEVVAGLRAAVDDIAADAPALYGAYDRIADAAPDGVDADVAAVKGVTAALLAELRRLRTPADLTAFNDRLAANPRIRRGVAATRRLDEWIFTACGIGIAD